MLGVGRKGVGGGAWLYTLLRVDEYACAKCKANAKQRQEEAEQEMEQEIGAGDWSRRLEKEIGAGDWSRRLEQEKIRSREEGGRRRMACTRTPKSGRVCVCEMHVGRACSRHKYIPHTSVLVRTDPKPRARRPESARGHIV